MCRSFLPRPVPWDRLRRAFSLAMSAPSAGNTQGWAFVVVEGEHTKAFWRLAADRDWLARPDHPGLLLAPAVVLPLASREAYARRYMEPDKASLGPAVDNWDVPYWLVDTAFATMLFLLGVTQEGLGALFFSLRRPAGPLLRELGVPQGWEPLGAIAVGWPDPAAKKPAPSKKVKKTVEEVVHRGTWGGAPPRC